MAARPTIPTLRRGGGGEALPLQSQGVAALPARAAGQAADTLLSAASGVQSRQERDEREREGFARTARAKAERSAQRIAFAQTQAGLADANTRLAVEFQDDEDYRTVVDRFAARQDQEYAQALAQLEGEDPDTVELAAAFASRVASSHLLDMGKRADALRESFEITQASTTVTAHAGDYALANSDATRDAIEETALTAIGGVLAGRPDKRAELVRQFHQEKATATFRRLINEAPGVAYQRLGDPNDELAKGLKPAERQTLRSSAELSQLKKERLVAERNVRLRGQNFSQAFADIQAGEVEYDDIIKMGDPELSGGAALGPEQISYLQKEFFRVANGYPDRRDASKIGVIQERIYRGDITDKNQIMPQAGIPARDLEWLRSLVPEGDEPALFKLPGYTAGLARFTQTWKQPISKVSITDPAGTSLGFERWVQAMSFFDQQAKLAAQKGIPIINLLDAQSPDSIVPTLQSFLTSTMDQIDALGGTTTSDLSTSFPDGTAGGFVPLGGTRVVPVRVMPDGSTRVGLDPDPVAAAAAVQRAAFAPLVDVIPPATSGPAARISEDALEAELEGLGLAALGPAPSEGLIPLLDPEQPTGISPEEVARLQESIARGEGPEQPTPVNPRVQGQIARQQLGKMISSLEGGPTAAGIDPLTGRRIDPRAGAALLEITKTARQVAEEMNIAEERRDEWVAEYVAGLFGWGL